ncbi:hypothetical protein C4D60_Mb04t13580 [Musa balbisiana]|uniref:Uncharacterized protein n=1 Tax=Musa balbisiana TaxID=52838 RepID=A0A4S8KBT7_MUSBA|nr:hypothetical protein C4D60_Mb04t13580 [Musa balbisiana]
MALIDRVLDSGRVIERQASINTSIQWENQELRARVGLEVVAAVEQCVSALEEEVTHLKAELEESQLHIRMLDNELLTLSHNVETARSSAWAAKEVLKEERLALPRKIKEALAEYKSSAGFEHGLVRSGRVTYEFGYRVAYACFRARYLDQELELDPFVDRPEDQDVDMPTSVPFDDGPETPPWS